MSINAVAPSPSTPALLTQFTSSSGPQPSTQTASNPSASSPSDADRVTITTAPPTTSAPPATTTAGNPPAPPSSSVPNLAAGLADPVGNYVYTIDGQSYSTTISTSGGEYTATVPGLGTITAPSEAAVEAAISVRISELA